MISIEQLATLCEADIQGKNTTEHIYSAADIMHAEQGQVTVLSDAKYKKYLVDCKASACFISPKLIPEQVPEHITLLVCADPEMAFLEAVRLLHPDIEFNKTISDKADIADSASLGHALYIGAFATIGQDSQIGDYSEIHPGVHIGRNVNIGQHCKIYPNAVIYDNTVIGDHVIIHSGAVIAADGFGYKYRNNQHVKVPHVGNVVIADHVEIGANTCIDRGALGSTVIGAGSKIDNLVQLGHNNQVGRNVIICGQSGISGSCVIEDGAILAGSSGIADHVKIGQQAVVMARSGVSQDVKAGTQVWGSPAKDRKVAWKELAALSKLPEVLKAFKALQLRVSKLEQEK
ncbi:UDP-3-O-(3-hydroxymyristoyl)glucosamine N-acyltransferase [methane-oxidizing endosymbiont of Gigantopelta aegis]|uniref:UDP-3-O-(3-hydroxymyristoyl)glucosamine N-acyltransferase n=1 Tax=methane-oxidizing endosymbiont of Gigantopelta aegis TaxID=2794938 RepID=UPI0018DE2FF0|nr:UDP-3-O-(3-hydroxymyristoyl)glucosamine N-acyltransferase [methane-oxidizing endosymbiont of Gigantopelta aegis]